MSCHAKSSMLRRADWIGTGDGRYRLGHEPKVPKFGAVGIIMNGLLGVLIPSRYGER